MAQDLRERARRIWGVQDEEPEAEEGSTLRARAEAIWGEQAAPEKPEGTLAGKGARQVVGGALDAVGSQVARAGQVSEKLAERFPRLSSWSALFGGEPTPPEESSRFLEPVGEGIRSAAPPPEPGLFAEVARGVGSSIGLAPGFLAGGSAGLALTGVLANGYAEGEAARARALSAGKSEQEANEAAWRASTSLWTTAAGLSELAALPRIFTRVDRRTGGLLTRAAKNIVFNAAEEAPTGAFQEFVSVLNENLDEGERQTIREMLAEHKARIARAGMVEALAVGPLSLVATAVQRPLEAPEAQGGKAQESSKKLKDPGQKLSLVEQAEAQGPEEPLPAGTPFSVEGETTKPAPIVGQGLPGTTTPVEPQAATAIAPSVPVAPIATKLRDQARAQSRYMGNKREFLRENAPTLARAIAGSQDATQLFDMYAGGGTYGLSVAASGSLPNLKRVVVNEVDPIRRHRLDLATKTGGSFVGLWESDPLLADIAGAIKPLFGRSSSKAAAALAVVSGKRAGGKYHRFVRFREALRSASPDVQAAFLAVQDQFFSGRTATFERILHNAIEDADRIKNHYDAAVGAGVSVEVVSLDATGPEAVALTQSGQPSVVILDPPYHLTSSGTYSAGGARESFGSSEFLARNIQSMRLMLPGNTVVYHNNATPEVRRLLASGAGANVSVWARQNGQKEIVGVINGRVASGNVGDVIGAGKSAGTPGTAGAERGVLGGTGGDARGQPDRAATRDDRRGSAPAAVDTGEAAGPAVPEPDRSARPSLVELAERYSDQEIAELPPEAVETETGEQTITRVGQELREAARSETRIKATRAERKARRATPPEERYQRAGETVDSREVGETVSNLSSIESSLNDWDELPGIREVPMSDFHATGKHYSVKGTKRIKELAEEIQASGRVDPLIVVLDKEGPYVLEGATRLQALHRLGAKSFPAVVVVDRDAETGVQPLEPAETSMAEAARALEASQEKRPLSRADRARRKEPTKAERAAEISETGEEDVRLMHAGPSLSGLGALTKRFLGMPTETDTGSLVPPEQTPAQRRRQEVQTAMEPFERAAASSGRPEFQQVAERATLYQDRAADRWRLIRKQDWKPIEKNIRVVGYTDANQYIYARHAPAANAVTRERTKGEKQAGSGMTDETARRVVQIAESGPNAEAFKELGRQWDALMQKNLDMAVEYQLITPETRDRLQKMYPHYAPLKTLMDEGERVALGIGKGADIRGPEFKMRLGRKTEADAPIAHGLAALQRTLLRGEKRRILQPFVDLVKEQGGEIEGFVKLRKSNLIEDLPPNVVGLGPDLRLEFEPEYQDFVDAIQNPTGRAVDSRNLFGNLTKMVGKLTRFESGMATRYNPVFPVINAIFRDPATAFIISQEHGLAFASRVVKDGPKAWLAMFDKGPWAKHADAYRAQGGQMGTLGIDDVQGHLESIKEDLSDPSTMKRGWRKTITALSRYADAGENAMRLSAFVHAQSDLGMTPEQAVAYSKNLTTNFRRKGLSGNYINAWWMFSNAGIQGTERAMRALGNKNVRRLVFSVTVMSAMLDLINRWGSDEDEDGVRFYDAIPEYIKRNNILIVMPGGRRFLTIPAPFVFNWFHALGTNIGANAWDKFTGEDISGSFVGNMALATMDSFNPLGGTDKLGTLLAPTILDPLVELKTNEDFAGRQIAKKPFPGQKLPPSEQYWPDVNPTVQAITSKLNEWTGGDKYEAGDVSINPEWIEHLGKFLTSGTGQFVGQLYDIPDKALRGEEVTAAQIPLIRRLVKDPSPFAVGGRYRDARDEVRLATKRTEGEPGPPTAEDKPLYTLRQQLTNAERQIEAKEKKLAAAKTKKLRDKLEAEIREIQAKFTRRVNEAKKSMETAPK